MQSRLNINELPSVIQNYIHSVLLLAKQLQIELASLILFGSLVKGNYSAQISDVDLLVVVQDSTPRHKILTFKSRVEFLKNKYISASPNASRLDLLFKHVQRNTGMFISSFICKETDLLHLKFNKIFAVNPVLSFFLAPKSLVLNSFLTSSVTLHGKAIHGKLDIPCLRRSDIIKSFLMTLIINLLALLTFKFYNKSTKLSLEAVKWALYSSYLFETGSSGSLDTILQYYIAESTIGTGFAGKFLHLRNANLESIKFIKKSFQCIKKIHFDSLYSHESG